MHHYWYHCGYIILSGKPFFSTGWKGWIFFMTRAELAKLIDHTILKPEATEADVRKVIAEAAEYQFASACVSPCYVRLASEMLAGSGVLTCAVIGFPHGTNTFEIKSAETRQCVRDGAEEIDVVAHLPFLMNLDLVGVTAELKEINEVARRLRQDVVIKVIVESALLTKYCGDNSEQAIEIACQAVRDSGCDFIKTSTGFHPAGGASVAVIKWMKKYADGIRVKASGGIRDWATANAMLDAGADRLGMSASVEVLRQMEAQS
jgi:deoxyribose-phosphate aldolase